jgi:hypothetical protein
LSCGGAREERPWRGPGARRRGGAAGVVGRNGARCRGPRHVGALRTSATCAGFGERGLARNDTECFSAPRCSSFLCKLVLHSGGVPHTEPRCGQPQNTGAAARPRIGKGIACPAAGLFSVNRYWMSGGGPLSVAGADSLRPRYLSVLLPRK